MKTELLRIISARDWTSNERYHDQTLLSGVSFRTRRFLFEAIVDSLAVAAAGAQILSAPTMVGRLSAAAQGVFFIGATRLLTHIHKQKLGD